MANDGERADLLAQNALACGATGDLAALSVSSRIPEFWRQQPKLWFIQFEAITASQRLSDDQRWQSVIAKLLLPDLQQVSDLLTSPPAERKYDALKARLISANADSELRQFQKLLGEMQLGDQRPSQLLRRMRDLARDKVSDDALKFLWAGHLPTAVRAVLAVSDKENLEDLAVIADSVLENTRYSQVNELSPVTHPSQSMAMQESIAALTTQMTRICAELAALRDDTGISAAEMVYGTTIRLPGEFFEPSTSSNTADENYVDTLREHIRKIASVPKREARQTAVFVHPELSRCTHVFIRCDRVTKPLTPPYEGPYPIVKRNEKYFIIKLPNREVAISIDRLKAAFLPNDVKDNSRDAPAEATKVPATRSSSSDSDSDALDPYHVSKFGRKCKKTVRFTV